MSRLEFKNINGKGNSGSKEYKVIAICNSAVYAKKSDRGYLPGFYYLILWKSYSEKDNTWEPTLAVLYIYKLISIFYRDYLEKLTTTFSPIHSISSIAKSTVRLTKASNTK